MNRKQFARLFLVAFLPLLLLGILAAKIVFNRSYLGQNEIFCINADSSEYCQSVGPDNVSYSEIVRSRSPAWFYIDDENNYFHSHSSLDNLVYASARTVMEAEVLEVSAYANSGNREDSKIIADSLVQARVFLKLGIENDERSFIRENQAVLYCNSLSFLKRQGEYSSKCFGNDWHAFVTYQLTGHSRNQIEQLESSIHDQVESRNSSYLIYRLVMYPIFIYVFLIISFLIWLTIKAFNFVKGEVADQDR